MTAELKNILRSLELKIEEKKSEESPLQFTHDYFDLATRELVSQLLADYPHDWAFYVGGSWGRRALTKSSDQDHYLVTSVPLSKDQARVYESGFRLIENFLDQRGLGICDGGIMASRPAWRFSIEDLEKLAFSNERTSAKIKADVLFHSRLLAGKKDLRPRRITDFFQSAEFRKLCLHDVVVQFFYLFFSIRKKSRIEHLKRISLSEAAMLESLTRKDVKPDVKNADGYVNSLRQGATSLKKILRRYPEFFPR